MMQGAFYTEDVADMLRKIYKIEGF